MNPSSNLVSAISKPAAARPSRIFAEFSGVNPKFSLDFDGLTFRRLDPTRNPVSIESPRNLSQPKKIPWNSKKYARSSIS